jgi:hypothetical protein
MVISYILGQRKYYIDYDLSRILGYLFISLTLFALSHFIQTGHLFTNLILKNGLLVLFLVLVYRLEKNNLKAIISRTS